MRVRWLILMCCCLPTVLTASEGASEIARQLASDGAEPVAIRNDIAQPADPIVTKRYWRIKQGSFPEFLRASREGVWPFFEKIGARVIGMWQVQSDDTDRDYDEVYLLTQYASVAHWRATRDMAGLGGNGPDWEAARQALILRRELTIETSVEFMQGLTWHSPPQYLPGLPSE